MKILRTLGVILILLGLTVSTHAQQSDSLAHVVALRDSAVAELNAQIHELKLQQIMMQGLIEKSGATQRADSLRRVRQKQSIDSLRNLTPGEKVIIDGDTLFTIYASRGGSSPMRRAREVEAKIQELGKRVTFSVDSLTLFESEYTTDIMSSDRVIMSVSDLDGLWEGRSRTELAEIYREHIAEAISHLHDTYGLQAKLMGTFWAIIIIAIQVLLFIFTKRMMQRVRKRIIWAMRNRIKPLVFRGYELLNVRRGAQVLLFVERIAFITLIVVQLFISIPLLFSIFPETKDVTLRLFSYVWNPLRDIGVGIVSYIPNAIKIIIIIICFRYLIRAFRYVATEIAEGRMKFEGFYADWAMPTFHILRALVYCFMVVMIWPLLPSSDSEIFKGVSVFVGLVFSLGSTTIIGNIISGIVITYMRPFKVGDFVEINGTKGEIIEKTAFVTRLRTPKREIITVPNSAIMSSQTTNFSSAARQRGVIIHTEVTIGYSTEREVVEKLLLDAAASCSRIMKNPKPFVQITALEDFYIRYEINAYTQRSLELGPAYSELHKAIVDHFNAAHVEIMSPHFRANRDGSSIEIPSQETT